MRSCPAARPAAEGEAALRQQIALLRDQPVTVAELAEAKNQILTSTIESRETAAGKAATLASAVIIDGDPRAADEQLTAIAKVTAADVQRVARKYLAEDHSAAIRYLPAESAPAGAKGDTITVPETVAVAPLVTPPDVPVVTEAAPADRAPLPKPGPVGRRRHPLPRGIDACQRHEADRRRKA